MKILRTGSFEFLFHFQKHFTPIFFTVVALLLLLQESQ